MYVRPLIREASAWTVEHAGAKMSKKFNTENIKNIHDEWKKTYPSFVERRNNEQLASNKLDRSFGLGYHRTITDGNARHAQLNASPSRIPGISGRQTHSKTDVSLPQEQSGRRHLPGIKTSSIKRPGIQVASRKPQAPSSKLQAPRPKVQASSHKQQAS